MSIFTYTHTDRENHLKVSPLSVYLIVIRYPQQIVQKAFCDLSHAFHKHITNVSHHVFVTLLLRILTSFLR